MPLPTTVTTAKQNAAKALDSRKRNQAQAAADLEAITIRPNVTMTAPTPLEDAQISNELLDHFHNLGMTREQIRTVAGQWLITQTELRNWETKIDQADTAERARITREIAKLAAQMEVCILQRGQVTTDAIRVATPDRLLAFIAYYEAELDELYPLLATTEDGTAKKAEHQAAWDRLNGYLWECHQVAGTNPVTLSVFTGQSLEAELDQALKEASKP